MRAKLALLAAAAVVFAPGWQASDAVPGRPAGVDLAARILAPTFDEASAVSQADRGAYKALDRAKTRKPSSKFFAWQSAAYDPPSSDFLWSALVAVVLLAVTAGSPSTRSPRAPPLLLTV